MAEYIEAMGTCAINSILTLTCLELRFIVAHNWRGKSKPAGLISRLDKNDIKILIYFWMVYL